MRAVVIRIRADIVLFDNGEPRSERHLIAVECVEDVKATEELEAEKDERMLFGQLFESEYLKVPIEHRIEQLGDLLWHFELYHGSTRARLATSASND